MVHLFSSPVAFLLDLYLKTCQLTKKHRRLSGRSSILSLIGGPLHYSHQSHLFIHVAAPLSHFKMKGEKMWTAINLKSRPPGSGQSYKSQWVTLFCQDEWYCVESLGQAASVSSLRQNLKKCICHLLRLIDLVPLSSS